jgi:clan AA aspartic protease
MGLVMTKIRLTNFEDVRKQQGTARSIEIEALVDTGAINLAIPEEVAEALGVPVVRRRRIRVADGRSFEADVVAGLQVEILGREVTAEAIVLPRGATALLGAVQLELLDLVVVPSTGEVVPNPAHPDGPILPLLQAG